MVICTATDIDKYPHVNTNTSFAFLIFADVHCGELYTIDESSHTAIASDIYLTETVFTCVPGLRLNDGHENATVECMATGYWRDHDVYTDCAGQLYLLKILVHQLCSLLSAIIG